MGTTIVFYILLVLAVGGVAWSISDRARHFRVGMALCVAGAVILLASVFLLPWVIADSPEIRDRNIASLLADEQRWWAVRVMIAVRDKSTDKDTDRAADREETTLIPEASFDLTEYMCSPSRYEKWCSLLDGSARVSAWQVLVGAPAFSRAFKASLWGRLVLGVGAALVGILVGLQAQDAGARAHRILGVISMLFLLLGFWQIPVADTLGLHQELKLDLVNLVSGVRTGPGMWWLLVGLACIVVGCGLEEVAASNASTRVQDEGTDYGGYYC